MRRREKARLVGLRRRLAWLSLAVFGCLALRAADFGTGFSTPDAAVDALIDAASRADRAALRGLFGLETDELVAIDQVQATNELAAFSAAAQAGRRLVAETDDKYVLELGTNQWPFPIPILRREDRWHFDTNSGKEEVLNRRIGRNELTALQVARVYVEAQREYAGLDRDGDEVLEYATKFESSEGKKDGLYWSPGLDGELSPLGPLVARAYQEGYRKQAVENSPEPFHGYYFKILTRQGGNAPGGKYDYVINENMIGGFALVAWPAQYGESGIMTFVVNQRGRVYQKDLGAKTSKIAGSMLIYDPDPTWNISSD